MTKALSILIVLGVLFVGWRVMVYWETVQEEQRAERRGEAARAAQLQNLPGLPHQLENSFHTARSQGERALGEWLKQFGHLVQDPRKAAIELDFCQLLIRNNPAEARRIFAAVRERTPPTSPVWPRIKELERSFQ